MGMQDGIDVSGEVTPTEDLADEVLQALRKPQKELPTRLLYDQEGARLFERICELDEYYLTRTELAIMEANVGAMASRLGAECLVIEPGSGSGRKTRLLLAALERPAAYVPVDIARESLVAVAESLRSELPDLEVLPVWADFTGPFELPHPTRRPARNAIYFPGSTIGNFRSPRAKELLRRWNSVAGPGGALLIGVDLRKDVRRMLAAYDDAEGVTAAFNRNILVRLNRELGTDFDLDRFEHRAVWNEREGRVEMHLVSRAAQEVTVAGKRIALAEGETIHTENSYKYTLEEFADLGHGAGCRLVAVWTDEARWFSVQYFEVP
jgi:L-histidine N-alpha-methyltransferase